MKLIGAMMNRRGEIAKILVKWYGDHNVDTRMIGQILTLFPKGDDRGLLSDEEIKPLLREYEDSNKPEAFDNLIQDIKQAQKALDDDRLSKVIGVASSVIDRLSRGRQVAEWEAFKSEGKK